MIEPWQRKLLADYFGGTREPIVVVSKKNGKTSLFAALVLWHVISVAFADVAILAASRDQAGKLLQQLTGYIKRSAELREQLRITQRVVHCERTEGKVAVMAADSDTLDGWGDTLALVDELGGRHKNEENFGLLRDGLGPRDGQLVAFSTAGDTSVPSAIVASTVARRILPPVFSSFGSQTGARLIRSAFACQEARCDSVDKCSVPCKANSRSQLLMTLTAARLHSPAVTNTWAEQAAPRTRAHALTRSKRSGPRGCESGS